MRLGPSNDRILITREKRYGLPQESFSAPNGYVRTGETARDTVDRILLDEFHLKSDLVTSLGSYRIQVNRGGGFLHIFVAENASYVDDHLFQLRLLPKSNKKSLVVSRDELLRILKQGEGAVGEIQWAATLGMGLLHY